MQSGDSKRATNNMTRVSLSPLDIYTRFNISILDVSLIFDSQETENDTSTGKYPKSKKSPETATQETHAKIVTFFFGIMMLFYTVTILGFLYNVLFVYFHDWLLLITTS